MTFRVVFIFLRCKAVLYSIEIKASNMWLTLQNMDSYSSTRRFLLGGLTAVLKLPGLVILHDVMLSMQDRHISGMHNGYAVN